MNVTGELVGNPAEEAARWEEFFAELFIGDLHEELPQPEPPPPPDPNEVAEVRALPGPEIERARKVLVKLKSNQGMGPDEVPAGLFFPNATNPMPPGDVKTSRPNRPEPHLHSMEPRS